MRDGSAAAWVGAADCIGAKGTAAGLLDGNGVPDQDTDVGPDTNGGTDTDGGGCPAMTKKTLRSGGHNCGANKGIMD